MKSGDQFNLRHWTGGGIINPWAAIVPVLLVFILASCATKPIAKNMQPKHLEAVEPILVLSPIVNIKSIEDELPMEDENFDIVKLRDFLSARAQSLLSEKGLVLSNEKIPVETLAGLQNTFHNGGVKPFRSRFNVETDDFFNQMDEALNGTCVLLLKTDIYLGPGGWWDPNSGAIRSGMNRTLIKARIIDTSTRAVIWKNQVQYRDRPEIESENFEEAINMVFDNLKCDGKEKGDGAAK